ncbi:unnamed protein product [Phytomonas sp. EM1]|nr:unnamed protein product [Phytomonas sp. EM1]|eukprot:CCW63838.1 unnamed protein product [Phytomonas sp. isolate EM1]
MEPNFQPTNPATGEALPLVHFQDVSEVPKAMERARAAQREWSKLSYSQRGKHLLKIRDFLSEHADHASTLISQYTGKLKQDALATEVLPSLLGCAWYATNTARVLRPETLPRGSLLFANKRNTLVYEPLGVVGIISPWNYPFSIPFGEILMALMAGNAVLLKVSSHVTAIGEFITTCIAAGGLPEGLFQHLVLPGPKAGPALLHAGIAKIFFTGSVRVGKGLMADAAPYLTPLSLELGGNDAMVVLDDADLERAVNCACWAGFQNAGQSCGGVERVYVDRALYDAFLARLVEKTRALRHGAERGAFDVDLGAITTAAQLEAIQAQLNEAVAMGARVVAQSRAADADPAGNRNPDGGESTQGRFFPATVVVGCTPEMRLMREETFGPILAVVPFDSEDEAVELANGTTLALTSSVFSRNASRARAFARRLESGVVTVNDHLFSHGMTEAPWGGWKESGLGRTHGILGLREMCNVKCINEDLIPSRWMPRNLWWYPFSKQTYEVLLAAQRLVSARRISERIAAVFFIIKNCGYMFRPWRISEKKSD